MSGKLDLSTLPPEIRQKVEAGLAKLPPDVRRQWEEQGSPMLAKLVAGLAGKPAPHRKPPPVPPPPPKQSTAGNVTRTTARPDTYPASLPRDPPPSAPVVIRRTPPHGHYNDTIAPGDRPGLMQRLLLGAAIAGVAAWLFR